MYKKVLAFCLIIILGEQISAQEKDSILTLVANDYGQEKMFIHFDKSVYKSGETVWFKAYIQNGNQPSTISKNFYADWYNDSGKLIMHQSFPIIQATTNGQFIIDSNYKSKQLHLKAYTTWMLNFDTAFLYHSSINIYQSNFSNASNKQIKPILNFYPEGGDLVNGIGGFIAFKSTDQFGNPLPVKGVIKKSNNTIVDSFKTEYDGMGMVYMDNADSKETYTAYWQDTITNTPQQSALPKVIDDGVALQIQTIPNAIIANITRTENTRDENKTLHLMCFMGNNTLYNAKIKMQNKVTQQVEIPTKSMGTGVLQVTVFNASYLPLAERMIFVNNNDYKFNANVTVTTKNTNKRGKNEIEVSVADNSLSNMSIAVTDANIYTDSTTNIFSHLLLQADIKGNITNASYYLQNTELAQQHLDLLMLTNGWRKYNWQKILSNQLPPIKYTKDTTYLNIIGTTYANLGNILPQQQLILFTETTDSLRKQFILPVTKKGVFGKTNFIFYDRLKLTYSFLGNKKLNADADVVFSNGLFNKPLPYCFNATIANAIKIDYAYYEQIKKLNDQYKQYAQRKGKGDLEELTIATKRKRAVDVLDEKYASNLFSGGDAIQFDVMNDTRAQSSFNVFQYLTGTVAGLSIINNGPDVNVTWRGSQTSFFLDEMNIDAEVAGTINMNEVAYIKVFRPPFYGSSGGGAGGAIAIYTRKGNDAKSIPGKVLAFKYIDGYTAIKQFYSPNYEQEINTAADLRETLYWNPYIITNHLKNKVNLSFYNNDISKKFRIVLCGVNEEGKMVWIDKIIE